jgi:hypothetical protein
VIDTAVETELLTGAPDFIGVGTAGAGTRQFHGLLLAHPQIVAPRDDRREVHFFEQFCTREMSDEDIEAYHELFPRPAGAITGEWTPRYVYDAWTPLLLERAAPDAKLLMLVGDPMERYRDRLERELAAAGPDIAQLLMADVVGRSRFAAQLRNLLRHFDREQVLVLQSEKCERDAPGEYRRTLRFLGVDEDFLPHRIRPKPARAPAPAKRKPAPSRYRNMRRRLGLARRALTGPLPPIGGPAPAPPPPPPSPAEPPPLQLWPDLEAALRAELEAEIRDLKTLVPELDLSLWPAFDERRAG